MSLPTVKGQVMFPFRTKEASTTTTTTDIPSSTMIAPLGEVTFGLATGILRPGLTRLLVSCQLVRKADVKRFPRFVCAAQVFEHFKGLGDLDREVFLAVLLDRKNRATGVNVVSIGTLSSALVHPREVFKTAILGNADSLFVLHNHPSNDSSPSREDREITTRLANVGKEIGITLLDHVVITSDSYTSFSERGLL